MFRQKKSLVALTLAVLLMFTLALAGCGADKPADQPQAISGTITDATMNGITIQDAAQKEYHFNETDDTKIEAADGIVIGETVDITYEGDLENNPTALTITVK